MEFSLKFWWGKVITSLVFNNSQGILEHCMNDIVRPIIEDIFNFWVDRWFKKTIYIYISQNKQVNNTLIAYIYQRVYIRLPRRYLFVGHVNRHWGAFAKRCINNRMIRHDAKGTVPIVYCLRKMHLWGSKLHAGYSIPLRIYLGWSGFWGRCQ